MRFETFVRKLKHIKFLDKRFHDMNNGFTKLLCNADTMDSIYVHVFDEIYELTVAELIKDIEDELMVESQNNTVQDILDYFIYDAEMGLTGKFWIPGNTRGFDYTVWNVYANLFGVLNHDVADNFENPKVTL